MPLLELEVNMSILGVKVQVHNFKLYQQNTHTHTHTHLQNHAFAEFPAPELNTEGLFMCWVVQRELALREWGTSSPPANRKLLSVGGLFPDLLSVPCKTKIDSLLEGAPGYTLGYTHGEREEKGGRKSAFNLKRRSYFIKLRFLVPITAELGLQQYNI